MWIKCIVVIRGYLQSLRNADLLMQLSQWSIMVRGVGNWRRSANSLGSAANDILITSKADAFPPYRKVTPLFCQMGGVTICSGHWSVPGRHGLSLAIGNSSRCRSSIFMAALLKAGLVSSLGCRRIKESIIGGQLYPYSSLVIWMSHFMGSSVSGDDKGSARASLSFHWELEFQGQRAWHLKWSDLILWP